MYLYNIFIFCTQRRMYWIYIIVCVYLSVNMKRKTSCYYLCVLVLSPFIIYIVVKRGQIVYNTLTLFFAKGWWRQNELDCIVNILTSSMEFFVNNERCGMSFLTAVAENWVFE